MHHYPSHQKNKHLNRVGGMRAARTDSNHRPAHVGVCSLARDTMCCLLKERSMEPIQQPAGFLHISGAVKASAVLTQTLLTISDA